MAIKQIALNNMKNEQKTALQKEINLLQKLDHANVVKYIGNLISFKSCIDTIYSEHYLNIVLEYMDGGSLDNLIKEFGKLSEELVALYIS